MHEYGANAVGQTLAFVLSCLGDCLNAYCVGHGLYTGPEKSEIFQTGLLVELCGEQDSSALSSTLHPRRI